MKRSILTLGVLCGLVLVSSHWLFGGRANLHAQSQQTADCAVVADTRLEEKAPSTNYATGTTLWGAGNVNSLGQLAEAAMKFDCSTSGIPAGSTISAATLTLNVTFPTTDTYDLYEFKRAWTESGATWTNADSSTPWQVAGARGSTDRDTLSLGLYTGDGTTGSKVISLSQDGLSAITKWINDPATNNGIMLRPPLANDDVGFNSRETSAPPELDLVSTTGTQYTLLPTADTRLEEKAKDTNYQSGTTLWAAGNVNGIGEYAEAALQFDATGIPTGTTFQSGTLKISVTFPSVDTYELYELKQPWTEAGATWNNYATGLAWQVPGAKGSNDRSSTRLGSISAPGDGVNSIALNAQGLAAVNNWVNSPASNHGVVLRAPLNNDDVGFSSREAGATGPRLHVTYTPPPPTQTRFKMIHWNVHHGEQQDGSTPNVDDVAQFIADEQASVADLNETPSGYPASLASKLSAKTGRSWQSLALDNDAIVWMTPGSAGSSPLGMDKVTSALHEYASQDGWGHRMIGTITFHTGVDLTKTVTIGTTHLACDNVPPGCGSEEQTRVNEVTDLLAWDDSIGDPLVVGTDFNDTPGSQSYNVMVGTNGYVDTDVNGMTTSSHGHRIDYIFYRKSQTQLTLSGHGVKTPLASNDQWPSDHKPVWAQFDFNQ